MVLTFTAPRITFVLCALLGTALPTLAQTLPMVTKHLYDFATPSGGGYPNDQINDNQAFANAAAFFQARNGYGTLILEDGEYIVGRQQLHQAGDPLPGPDWGGYGYPTQYPCATLVAYQTVFTLVDCAQLTVQGGSNTSIRYRDCLYYGTFLHAAGTNEVFSAAGVDLCHSCESGNHLSTLLHAEVGSMFTFYRCDSMTIRDVELNGNIDGAIMGGRSSGDGIQTGYDGVVLYESANCVIDHVDAHHFGRDGLLLWAGYWEDAHAFTTAHPNLNVDSVVDPGTIVFNNKVLQSSFNWNCRQGISWTACSGLQVTDCVMNYNGAGRFFSSPSTGLDIEGGGGPMRVRHGIFNDCRFLHNLAAGIHSNPAGGPCLGQQDFRFTNCVVKAGQLGSAIWPGSRQMVFDSCEVYGNVGRFFEQAENIPRDPAFDLVFTHTNFHEEDDQWSYIVWTELGLIDTTHCGAGPHMFKFTKSRRSRVTFDHCGFYTNCKAVVRFIGRDTADVFPYCILCDNCPNCGPDSCLTLGPCIGCSEQDDRYVRVTNCEFVNTGRNGCGAFTELISGENVFVDGLSIAIPDNVRNGIAGAQYYAGFTECAPYCAGYTVDTIPTTVFPACLPFFTLPDTIVRWAFCDPDTMPIPNCISDANCYSDLVLYGGTLSSTLASPLSGTVYIEGQFIVDQSFTFDSAQVSMAPGAEMVVLEGATLYITNSSVSSCQGVMWKSMTVNSGAILKIRDSFVDDAEDAVWALDGSIVLLDGNQFRNNRVAVQVPYQTNVAAYDVSIHAVDNTFYSEGTMPVPYPGQTTDVGAQGYAAFDINRISLDLSAGPNLIHNLSNGIVAVQSDLLVTQATFLHIQPDSAYAHYANGSGIYARAPKNFHYVKVSGFGTDNAALPSFQDCYWGVYTEYMSVYSNDNFMLDVGTAYRVDRSGYMQVDIQYNRLDTRRDGIVLVMNDGAAYVLVEHNDILFARNLPPGQTTKGYYGIRVFEANTLNLNSKIQNNTIRYRQGASTAYGGIGLVSARAYLVANNTMLMTDNASNYVGILLQGCKNADVKCNDVHGANNGYLHLGQAGIRNWMGTAPLISCNTVDKTTNGALFSGPGLDVELRGNEFNNHRWGLHLELYTVIGTQDRRGNLWNVPIPSPGLGAWNENTLSAINNLIKYDPGQSNNVPSSYAPSGWFGFSTGNTFHCSDSLGECVGYKERCTDCPKEIYEQIANDSIQNGVYTAETRWTLKGDLYSVLKKAPALLQDADMVAFYAAVQNTVVGQLKDLDDDRLQLFDLDSTVLAQLQQNRDQLLLLQGNLKTAMGQLAATGLTATQITALHSTISGLQQSIGNLVTLNTTALELAVNSRVLTAANVKSANAGIGATELTETNYKTVNAIYLSTVAKNVDGFTSQQAEDLFAVANQCPLVGGNAVFQARALYYLVDPEQEFDDPTLCLQQGLITKSMKLPAANAVGMVPNPADDNATLVLTEPLEDGGQLLMTNAMGAVVLSVRIPADQLRTIVHVNTLASGIYHYRVRAASGEVGHGVLNITH